ncbi:hypothetical protein [Polaromonas hydrogenivorans]|uniref:HTH iclR-type domain-containing protein n=1 Tax=Polaromonas hydrogenivorans TaxID=335476 RepID=A0AAU7LY17_9BURK
MPLSPSTLQAIQQAGLGLFNAHQAVSADVQAGGARAMAQMASQPFSPDNDAAYKKLLQLARMAHELQAMEEQLKLLYAQASEATSPDLPVLIALSSDGARGDGGRAAPRPDKAGAEEAVVKPAAAKRSKAAKVKQSRLSPNDEKVMEVLKSLLDRHSARVVTQASLAQATGIPLGSIGRSLRNLVAAGSIKEEGAKGAFRLG